MTNQLQGLLLDYIRENNPKLLNQLVIDDGLHQWVIEKIKEVELVLSNAKPSQLTNTSFMEIFQTNLQPSRFRYVRELLEAEFTDVYDRMLQSGTLQYELVNMVSACHHLFEETPFIEGMDNPQLDHAVAELINDYLEIPDDEQRL